MIYDFKTVLLGLDDKPVKVNGQDVFLNKALSEVLSDSSRGPVAKFMDWARLLYKDEPINIDRADKRTLSEFIEGHERLTNLAKDQILKILNAQQDPV